MKSDENGSGNTSTPDTQNQSNHQSHNQTRTRVHMIAAALGAAFLIIAALATPRCTHFMLSRQVRAIQRGVVADLTLVAEAEKRFFAVHGFYTTDLRLLLGSNFPKVMVYKVGFVRPSVSKLIEGVDHDPNVLNFDRLKAAVPDLSTKLSPVTKLNEIDVAKLASYCPDCTATDTGFKVVAAANLDQDPVLDVWTIDEKGVRQHLVDDLNQ